MFSLMWMKNETPDGTQIIYAASHIIKEANARIEEIQKWLPAVEAADQVEKDAKKAENEKEKAETSAKRERYNKWEIENRWKWFSGENPHSPNLNYEDFLYRRYDTLGFYPRGHHPKARIYELDQIITLASKEPIQMSLSLDIALKVFVPYPEVKVP